ncbi:hypothetical protein J6590_104380, partial [Homalodisca vitripennis]
MPLSVVQIYEANFGKRNYNWGLRIEEHWVFGSIGLSTKKFLIVPFESSSNFDTISRIFFLFDQKWAVAPGAIEAHTDGQGHFHYKVSVKPDVYNTGQIEGKVKYFSAVAKATNSNNLTIESRTFDSTIDNTTVPNSRTCGENVESKVLVDDDERFPNALAVVSDYRRGTEKKAFSQKTRNFGGVGDNNNRGRQQEVRSFSNSNRVFTKSSTEWTAVNYRKSGWNNNYKKRSEGYSINGSKMDSNISIVPDTEGKERPATGSAPTYSEILRSEVKNKVVRGTLKVSDSNPLKPAKRMRWLFLSGLDPVVSAQSITDYLHSLKGDAVFHCNKLVTRYSSYSSFKVGVTHEIGEELMHPNL